MLSAISLVRIGCHMCRCVALMSDRDYADPDEHCCRYHSAMVVLPASKVGYGPERGPGALLFGGKDDWRRLNDLWILRLNSVAVRRMTDLNQQRNFASCFMAAFYPVDTSESINVVCQG